MNELMLREQQPLALSREVMEMITRSEEQMRYSVELAKSAQGHLADDALYTSIKALTTMNGLDMMLASAQMPDTQRGLIELRQGYMEGVLIAHQMTKEAILIRLRDALSEPVPEKRRNLLLEVFKNL